MNEVQYRELCDACDSILRSSNATIERVAISWLHILNEHPTNLAKYADLFSGRRLRFFPGIKPALIQGRQWFNQCRRKVQDKHLPKRADVIFISHFLNESQAGAEEDFYFGKLPEDLQERGLSSLVVLRNHTRLNGNLLSSQWPSFMAPRLFFPNALSGIRELHMRSQLKETAKQIRSEAEKTKCPFERAVFERAAHEALASSSIDSTRLYHQIVELAALFRPKGIIVTYEGHAWERLVFAAVRRFNTGVRCIGFHHTILFPKQHAAMRSLGSEFDPDAILTAGNVTRDMFARAQFSKPLKLGVLGTHRRVSNEPIHKGNEHPEVIIPTCSVIPDGTVEECLFLFDFALSSAALDPNIHFLFRMHPVLSFDAIARIHPRLRNLPLNVKVSNSAISEDFIRCRWALYRGSSAAIHAVLAGLRPFYVDRLGEMTIDPLYEIHDWRCVVNTPENFISRANLDLKSDMESLKAEAESAIEYCNKYFRQTNIDVLYDAFEK